jgi:hypothetical protein
MKLFFSFFLLILFFFFSASCVNGADRKSATELYVQSGLEKQMLDIGTALLAGYKNNYSKSKAHTAHDRKIYQNISQVVENSFDIQSMKEIVISGLMKDISDLDMKHILEWLNSTVGKKITALEKKAGSKEGVKETQDYIRELETSSVTRERVLLIRELNDAMNITETTVNIALSTQFALLMTLKEPKNKFSPEDVQKLYEDFQKNRTQLEPMVQHQVHGSLLYIFQDITDEALEKYVTFTKSGSGRRYSSVTSSYILQAITVSSLQFALDISQL